MFFVSCFLSPTYEFCALAHPQQLQFTRWAGENQRSYQTGAGL